MASYLYIGICSLVVVIVFALSFAMTGKTKRSAQIAAILIAIVSWGSYAFHFEQVFVKRFGGVMSVTNTKDHQHIAVTWKEDNLWIESYDPETNTCYFKEHSRGSVMEGTVKIIGCNPIGFSAHTSSLSGSRTESLLSN